MHAWLALDPCLALVRLSLPAIAYIAVNGSVSRVTICITGMRSNILEGARLTTGVLKAVVVALGLFGAGGARLCGLDDDKTFINVYTHCAYEAEMRLFAERAGSR